MADAQNIRNLLKNTYTVLVFCAPRKLNLKIKCTNQTKPSLVLLILLRTDDKLANVNAYTTRRILISHTDSCINLFWTRTCKFELVDRPRNRSSRPVRSIHIYCRSTRSIDSTFDRLQQPTINSIDRLDFWPIFRVVRFDSWIGLMIVLWLYKWR